MRKYILGICLIAGLSFTACDGDEIFDEDAQLETDIALIEQFLSASSLEADTLLPSQIRMITYDEGTGDKASFGATVLAYYDGFLLDGTQFDSNAGGSPFSFIVDRGDVVSGWDIAIKELAKGGRATIFLPSKYGYGNRSFGQDIPANSVLVFDIDVVDIR
jgi:peptidylprolyl isomerase